MSNIELLDKKQKEAFDHVRENQFTIINGCAGTGKTFLINTIAEEIGEYYGTKIAPTGRAAKNINGMTIHRWLEPDVKEDMFGNVKIEGFKKKELFDGETLIIDECSMIDDEIWAKIQGIIRYSESQGINFKVVYVGDEGQLEPVGEGTPFLDLLKSNPKITFTLDIPHRQVGDDNDINDIANAYRKGVKYDKEYKYVSSCDLQTAVNAVANDLENTQYIAPMKKGIAGTKNVNSLVQSKIGNSMISYYTKVWVQEGEKWKLIDDVPIYKNDKIVITKNMCGNMIRGNIGMVFVPNGTTGIVGETSMQWCISKSAHVKHVSLNINGNEVFIPLATLAKSSDLGYALTVHKMQGSQADYIYYASTPDQAYMNNNRKLVYTAITRAKKHLYLVS